MSAKSWWWEAAVIFFFYIWHVKSWWPAAAIYIWYIWHNSYWLLGRSLTIKHTLSCDSHQPAPPSLSERWEEYKQIRRYENINDEKIKERLKGVYAEVLVEVCQDQPATISEIAGALGYHKEQVRKVVRWLEEAKLLRSFWVGFGTDEDLHELAEEKLKRMLRGLRGAVYKSVRGSRFYVLTFRGEGFLSHALESLDLMRTDRSNQSDP